MSKKEYKRQLVTYKDYFKDFKKTLPLRTLKKVYQIFLYIMTLETIPTTYLKSITGVAGLYEIRIEDDGNIYRVFCCFDNGNLVILFNGFQKKTQKTPQGEIDKAERIMNEYFESKNKKGK
jgi:phage-related protein